MTKTKEIKFAIKDLLSIGFTLVVLGIGMAYLIDVNVDIRDDWGAENCAARGDGFTTYDSVMGQCENGTGHTATMFDNNTAWNAAQESLLGATEITSKIGTIATVVVASVIIGVLLTYLYAKFARG